MSKRLYAGRHHILPSSSLAYSLLRPQAEDRSAEHTDVKSRPRAEKKGALSLKRVISAVLN